MNYKNTSIIYKLKSHFPLYCCKQYNNHNEVGCVCKAIRSECILEMISNLCNLSQENYFYYVCHNIVYLFLLAYLVRKILLEKSKKKSTILHQK